MLRLDAARRVERCEDRAREDRDLLGERKGGILDEPLGWEVLARPAGRAPVGVSVRSCTTTCGARVISAMPYRNGRRVATGTTRAVTSVILSTLIPSLPRA
ncbi:hypothetical protein GCM10025869_09780 [Homoserinibacter gongjuensis]|uniref:Uncharacterized protein n=1 Tax=Homoserinibacter gongjuensis TaxID=1162968 RepID=A0ABQ6JR86_9MICO|nr:hypothetical protein GCM10025869_09780 [Homoserinibacter gongjuensis]